MNHSDETFTTREAAVAAAFELIELNPDSRAEVQVELARTGERSHIVFKVARLV